jgi:metal-responsive CopG/Arc/MetJ family transcriptional regulator
MRNKLSGDEKKQKITFSINENLNELIENEIKKTKLKRSQIIEKILNEHFKK